MFRDLGVLLLFYIKVFGGIFCDMIIYDFDMVWFLLGEEVVMVYVMVFVFVDLEIGKFGDYDSVLLVLMIVFGK